jgi:hypothetical protein
LTVFDTLDELETYLPLCPNLMHVITVLDRALPYDQADGVYSVPECKDITYKVETFVTGPGLETEKRAGVITVEITLKGDQFVSFKEPESVYRLSIGRFLLSDGGYRRAIAPNLAEEIKTVRFYLPC